MYGWGLGCGVRRAGESRREKEAKVKDKFGKTSRTGMRDVTKAVGGVPPLPIFSWLLVSVGYRTPDAGGGSGRWEGPGFKSCQGCEWRGPRRREHLPTDRVSGGGQRAAGSGQRRGPACWAVALGSDSSAAAAVRALRTGAGPGRVGWDRKRRGRSRAGGGREAGRKAPGRAACSPRGGRWQGSGAERRRAGGVPGGPGAPVGERGPGTPGPDRSPGQTGWLPRGLRLLPTCAHRRPVKGRDPGAQVSSSLPGRGGWGPGLPAQVSVPSVTSGHPWPPLRFRSPSRSQGPRGRAPDALHILGAPHLSARIRPPARTRRLAAACTSASGRQLRVQRGLQHPEPPLRPLRLLFGKRRRQHRRERPGLRGSPLPATCPRSATCSLCCETPARRSGAWC